MKSLPTSDKTLLVRTGFSDDAGWQALDATVTTANDDDFLPVLDFVDDPAYRDVPADVIVMLAGNPDSPLAATFLIVADDVAMTSPEMPLLAVYRTEEEGIRTLRVVATMLWSIENNISVSNMDWEEFVRAADNDGIYRGF